MWMGQNDRVGFWGGKFNRQKGRKILVGLISLVGVRRLTHTTAEVQTKWD